MGFTKADRTWFMQQSIRPLPHGRHPPSAWYLLLFIGPRPPDLLDLQSMQQTRVEQENLIALQAENHPVSGPTSLVALNGPKCRPFPPRFGTTQQAFENRGNRARREQRTRAQME